MITVNNKVLEVGDTAVFRCGGKAVVTANYYLYYNYIKTEFLSDQKYTADGFYLLSGRKHELDIVDIIKAPEPEEIFIELTYNKGLDENIACCYDSFEYLTECKDYHNKDIAVLKVTMRDKKLISVEVVENDNR